MKKNSFLIGLATLIALLYNAWLIAIWLNPKVVNSSLLSGLSALDQPYHFLFTFTDILSGIFCLFLAFRLYKINEKKDNGLFMIFISIAGFGLTTAGAALFPYSDLSHSEGIPNPFKAPFLFIHDGLSVIALLFILLAVVFSYRIYRGKLLMVLMIIFVLTTLLSFVAGAIPQLVGPLGQQINAIICGIWLIFISWKVQHDTFQIIHEAS